MQETSALILSEGKVGGFLVAEIYVGVFQARFGSTTGAIIALGIPLIAIFLGGLSSMLIASRYPLPPSLHAPPRNDRFAHG